MSVRMIQERLAGYACQSALEDVRPFMKVREWPALEFWTQEFFTQQCAKLVAD